MPLTTGKGTKIEMAALEWEDDCGFVFQRKKVVKKENISQQQMLTQTRDPIKKEKTANDQKHEPSRKPIQTPAPTMTKATSTTVRRAPINTIKMTPKQIIDKRRRRSSFAISVRPSSIGVNLVEEAPKNVSHIDYHRHIHPDLPGPVRMRQLLVWAAQVVLKDIETKQQNRLAPESLIEAAQALIQGLMTNEVNTSWYQRPSNVLNTTTTQSMTQTISTNPVNETNLQCLEWMQKYQQELNTELDSWEAVDHNPLLPVVTTKVEPLLLLDSQDTALLHEIIKPSNTPNQTFKECTQWLQQAPLMIDRYAWSIKGMNVFEERAKDFCEDLFQRIFARYFPSDESVQPKDILRALAASS